MANIKLNTDALKKKIFAALQTRAQKILTPEEFSQIEFELTGEQPTFKGPKQIVEKLRAGLKS